MSPLVQSVFDLENHIASEKDRHEGIGAGIKLAERKLSGLKHAMNDLEKKEYAVAKTPAAAAPPASQA